ncbi:hypothetical protein F5H01DRAFT_337277 [Linnemannia elongata]|nr:hypothetical protein F5H01DRAFT_337277 [Linnemannia elongata]
MSVVNMSLLISTALRSFSFFPLLSNRSLFLGTTGHGLLSTFRLRISRMSRHSTTYLRASINWKYYSDVGP